MSSGARVALESLSMYDVKEALKRLKPKRSAGPDGLPAFLFRDCSSVLAKPLHYIFNKCLELGAYPVEWKLTRVIPVPKSKLRSDISGGSAVNAGQSV